MKTITSSQTIDALRTVFARNGLPSQSVSNGPQYPLEEFVNFMKGDGIKHITSAPSHPIGMGWLKDSCSFSK